MIMTTLGELSVDGGSYGIAAPAVEYSSNLPTYLRITDICDDGTLDLSNCKSVDSSKAYKYILHENDIVFARTGNSTGRNYFYDRRDGEFVYAGFLIKFSLNPERVNPRYIKYYVQSQFYWDWIASYNTGSTRGNINAKTYESMPIALPSRDVQDSIVKICDSISNKIRNSRQLNDYLAETADSLFINTFGHLKENAVLSDIANITMGQSPTGASYNNVGNGAVFYQGRGEFGWRFPTRRLFTTEPKRMVKAGDILMSVRAPVGDLNIAYEDCCIGRGLAGINCSYPSFCLYLMRSLCKKLNAYNSEGTVFGSINSKDLKNIEIALPNVDDIIGFEDKVVPIDNLIKFNEIENRNLSQLRDILLSKLMSGKIHVGY